MAEGYIGLEIEVNPEDLVTDATEYMEAQFPGWTANAANLETHQIEAIALMTSVAAEVAALMPKAAFRYLGGLAGLPAQEEVEAVATSTWTMIDTAGYTIPEGTVVSLRGADGEPVAFQTTEDVVIAPGVLTTAAGGVGLIAVEAGAAANSATAPVELITALDYVASIALVDAPSTGADAEGEDEFLNRLSTEFQLLAPRPILPNDFAILARRYGAYRALAIDGYNPEHNLLTVNQASIETDATGFTAAANTTIARSTAQAADGAASLSMTAGGAGDVAAFTLAGTSGVPVTAGETYTARAEIRAATTARTSYIRLRFYDAAGAVLATTDSAQAASTTTGWSTYTATAIAPANAAFAAIIVYVVGVAAAGEVHYTDKLALRRGTATAWAAGATPAEGNERTMAVAAIDSLGAPVSAATKTAIKDGLEAMRETNYAVRVMDPTTTKIDVTFTAVALDGYDPAEVQADAIQAVKDYLSPARWGLPTGGTGQEREWRNVTTVRLGDLYTVINNVLGVAHTTALTLAIDGNALAAADVTLPGKAPLPQWDTISGTVTA